MSYDDALREERAKRQAEAERKRAQAQVDAEMAAAERHRLGESLVRAFTGGMTSFAPSEGRDDVSARLQEALGLRGTAQTKPANAPKIDPSGDPLELLSEEERALLERRPYLKKLLLADIEQAEATGREERERAASRAELERAHAENDRAHEIAARIVKQRAEARGSQ